MRAIRAICYVAVTATLFAMAASSAVLAQQHENPVFEVASIKLNSSGIASGSLSPSGLVSFNNVTIRDLIRRAYDVPPERVEGGPAWIDRDRFDFVARAEAETSSPQRMLMLRAFLAERLKLVVRNEAREMPVFALVVARADRRLGPQLRPSSVDCAAVRDARRRGTAPPTPPGERPVCDGLAKPGFISAGGVTMGEMAANISRQAGRPVIDRTGLPNGYDVDLKWTPEGDLAPAERSPERSVLIGGPSFAVALEEQLGLRLEPTRAKVDVIVVQSVERPAEN
jgi:uncharacterized protein (TIGR03435 family)